MKKIGNEEIAWNWGARKRQKGAVVSSGSEGIIKALDLTPAFPTADLRGFPSIACVGQFSRKAERMSKALTKPHTPLYTSVYKVSPSCGQAQCQRSHPPLTISQTSSASRLNGSREVPRHNLPRLSGLVSSTSGSNPLSFFARTPRLFSLSWAVPAISSLG